MRVLALTVTRNEQHRHLERMLAQLAGQVDGHFVFDDRSTDQTVDICKAHGCDVVSRTEDIPPFLKSEWECREAAWMWFQYRMEPEPGDWVLAIDADEIAVAGGESLRAAFVELTGTDRLGVSVPIHEVWEIDAQGVLLIRVDGFWARNVPPRLFRWRPEGHMPHVDMRTPQVGGMPVWSGSVPTYVQKPFEENHMRAVDDAFTLLHFGYVKPSDRQTKYQRYCGLPGHNRVHVESILATPRLVPWTGPAPKGL